MGGKLLALPQGQLPGDGGVLAAACRPADYPCIEDIARTKLQQVPALHNKMLQLKRVNSLH